MCPNKALILSNVNIIFPKTLILESLILEESEKIVQVIKNHLCNSIL